MTTPLFQASSAGAPQRSNAATPIGASDPEGTALHIRPYVATDEAAVIALWERCELTRPWNDPRQDIARKLCVQPQWFLLGLQNGVVISSVMAGYDGHRGWVNYLAVAPQARRRGCARQLMAEVERQLRAAGCPKINLQIRTGNEALLGFYRRLGYVQDEVVSLGRRLIEETPRSTP